MRIISPYRQTLQWQWSEIHTQLNYCESRNFKVLCCKSKYCGDDRCVYGIMHTIVPIILFCNNLTLYQTLVKLLKLSNSTVIHYLSLHYSNAHACNMASSQSFIQLDLNICGTAQRQSDRTCISCYSVDQLHVIYDNCNGL